MSSDDAKRSKDVPWREAGPGMALDLLCYCCNQRKSRTGGKMFGPYRKLFRCLDCVRERDAQIA